MRRFFVEGISGDDRSVVITGDEFYHLSRVLRLKVGAGVIVFDGQGLELSGRVASVERERAVVEVTGLRENRAESPLEITLLQGMAKGGKMDVVIQKGTELGVVSIYPFSTERSVPRVGSEEVEKRLHRWRRIAVEAAKQCGRSVIPDIRGPVPFDEVIEGHGDCLKLIPWERESTVGLKSVLERYRSEGGGRVVVLVGPEGGLSQESVDRACNRGFQPVSLGPRVVRTETAAIAVLSILQYTVGDMG